jgi:small subunit ribosomal protein S18
MGGGGKGRGAAGDKDPKKAGARKRGFARRKVCKFCADKNIGINYKEAQILRHFITDRGKIIPRRISGNCAQHQRTLVTSIKQARMIALLPFSVTGK